SNMRETAQLRNVTRMVRFQIDGRPRRAGVGALLCPSGSVFGLARPLTFLHTARTTTPAAPPADGEGCGTCSAGHGRRRRTQVLGGGCGFLPDDPRPSLDRRMAARRFAAPARLSGVPSWWQEVPCEAVHVLFG